MPRPEYAHALLRLVTVLLAFFVGAPTALPAEALRFSVSTVAGLPQTNEYVDGPKAVARFKVCEMNGIAVDDAGNTYVACPYSVRKITPDGTVSTLAGHASAFGQVDGVGSTARFAMIAKIGVDANGYVYVTDRDAHTIRKISPSGEVTTLAGEYRQAGSADGTAAAARFNFPDGLAVTREGVVYVTEYLSHAIRRIGADGTVTTFLGDRDTRGAVDGLRTDARFTFPGQLTTDPSGNLYISVSGAIRKATPEGVVTTFARVAGSTDAAGLGGPTITLPPQYPTGVRPTLIAIAAGADGQIYWYDGTLCAIAPSGEATYLAASMIDMGYRDGVGAEARLGQQVHLAMHSSGFAVLADSYNSCVRRAVPVNQVPVPVIVTQPEDQEVGNWNSATISVVAECSAPMTYQWYEVYPGYGEIPGATSASYTIPSVTLSHTEYQVKIRCGSEEVTSRRVMVSVGLVPQFGPDGLGSATTVSGVPVVYTVSTVARPETLTFRWQLMPWPTGTDWTDVIDGPEFSGATTPSLTVKSPTLAMSGHLFRCVATNQIGPAYTGSMYLNVVPSLDEWRSTHFRTAHAEGDAADNADPDGDGLPNFAEYALARDPRTSDANEAYSILEQMTEKGTCLGLNFANVPNPMITYTVEASEDLLGWVPIWTSPGLQRLDQGSWFFVEDRNAPLEERPRRFLRLRIDSAVRN